MNEIYLNTLPNEILVNIASNLESKDKRNFSLVCNNINLIVNISIKKLSFKKNENETEATEHLKTLLEKYPNITDLSIENDTNCDLTVVLNLLKPNLKKLVIPGDWFNDDNQFISLTSKLPNLEFFGHYIGEGTQITNVGLIALGKNCPNLKLFFSSFLILQMKGLQISLNHFPV